MPFVSNKIEFTDAKIIYRNFSGENDKFNKSHKRTFSLVIEDPDVADRLIADGWYLKPRKMRDPDDTLSYILPVEVSWSPIPCEIMYAPGQSKDLIELTPETINMLDHVEIDKIDICVRPYNWTVNEKSGVKAYVDKMLVIGKESWFASRYQTPVVEDTRVGEEDTPWD